MHICAGRRERVVESVQAPHELGLAHIQGDDVSGVVCAPASLRSTSSILSSSPRVFLPRSHTPAILLPSPPLADSRPACRFTDRLAPWVHYVPIQNSYTDLMDALVFFRAHDKAAARIAAAGREWSRRYWRREDMVAYMYRCVLFRLFSGRRGGGGWGRGWHCFTLFMETVDRGLGMSICEASPLCYTPLNENGARKRGLYGC
jgi:hypothetical protein